MNDDLYLRAGEFLDRHRDPGIAARSDRDDDLAAVVADVERVRAMLRDVEPPGAGEARRLIATAMTGFVEPRRRGQDGPTRPGRGLSDTAPSVGRVLGLAAATVAVLAVGFVVARSLQRTGGDDDAFDVAAVEALVEEPATEFAEEPAEEPADQAAEEAAQEPRAELSTAAVSGSEAEASDTASSELAVASEPAAEEPAAEPVIGSDVRLDSSAPLTTVEELGAFGALLFAELEAGTLPPTPNTRCEVADVLGRVDYVLDGEQIDLLVAVDTVEGDVIGIDATTCAPVVEGRLPSP